MRKSLSIVAAALILVPIVAFAQKVSQKEIQEVELQPLKEGTKIIDFELQNLAGKSVALSSFKGKVVFLNFWATWCPPCRGEMPSMERLYAKLKDKGFEIVGVDLQENPKTVQKFVKEHKLSFPILLDRDGKIGGIYGARSIPTTYIIDRAGNVIAGAVGAREWDSQEYVSFFTRLLEAK